MELYDQSVYEKLFCIGECHVPNTAVIQNFKTFQFHTDTVMKCAGTNQIKSAKYLPHTRRNQKISLQQKNLKVFTILQPAEIKGDVRIVKSTA